MLALQGHKPPAAHTRRERRAPGETREGDPWRQGLRWDVGDLHGSTIDGRAMLSLDAFLVLNRLHHAAWTVSDNSAFWIGQNYMS